VTDEEANFIHVGRNHNLWAAITTAQADGIAHGVDCHVIHDRAHLVDDDGSDLIFATGNARRLA
jgi:hypothetical protein